MSCGKKCPAILMAYCLFSIEHVLQDLNQGGNNHIYPLVDPNVEFCGSNNLAYISSSRAKSEVRLILSRGLFIQSQNELP